MLVFSLAACIPGAAVALKNGDPPNPDGTVSCMTSSTNGDLVSDPVAGTALVEENGARYIVVWPYGWTGRSSGSEVEVLDKSGSVVVRTGNKVFLPGGYTGSHPRGFLTCAGAKQL